MIENIVSGNREVNNKEYPLRKEVNIIFPLDNLLPPSYNPANQILKTLTRTSTFQSDFQRAKQKWSKDHNGASKAKAQKPNGPPSCKAKV